jgi:hypothetical protein
MMNPPLGVHPEEARNHQTEVVQNKGDLLWQPIPIPIPEKGPSGNRGFALPAR